MPRPEASGPPANYYDATEAAKYTSSSRIIRVQAEIAARCVELLNFPAGARRLVVDVGCGSGLSGAALERAGHAWVGCDVSRDMLRVAARRAARDDDGGEAADSDDSEEEEVEEEEDGSEEADGSRWWRRRRRRPRRERHGGAPRARHGPGPAVPRRRVRRRGERLGAAVALLRQRRGVVGAAAAEPLLRLALPLPARRRPRGAPVLPRERRAGGAHRGGRAARGLRRRRRGRLPAVDQGAQALPVPEHGAALPRAGRAGDRGGGRAAGGRKRGRDWVLDKKAHQRKKGGRVRPDSKFTGRKRKDKF